MNNMGKVEKMVQSVPNGIITAAQLTKAGLHRGCIILSRAGNCTVSGAACMCRAVHGKMIFTCCSESIAAASIRMIPHSICWAILTAPRQDTL